ncbi:heavy metal-binding domain-containing protein [Flavobacterium sangjuense]|nr:heavy metal-binding domain-containing protein [Flavobacterium sangjuense]
MKRVFISAIIMALVLVSCTKKSEGSTTTVTSDDNATEKVEVVKDTVNEEPETLPAQLYACSMHPEVQGKQNDECSKCGMALTELVPGETK